MRIRLNLGGIGGIIYAKMKMFVILDNELCGIETREGIVAKHILIVDDDALMRRSLAFNLEQAGYRASTAESAETALSQVQPG